MSNCMDIVKSRTFHHFLSSVSKRKSLTRVQTPPLVGQVLHFCANIVDGSIFLLLQLDEVHRHGVVFYLVIGVQVVPSLPVINKLLPAQRMGMVAMPWQGRISERLSCLLLKQKIFKASTCHRFCTQSRRWSMHILWAKSEMVGK